MVKKLIFTFATIVIICSFLGDSAYAAFTKIYSTTARDSITTKATAQSSSRSNIPCSEIIAEVKIYDADGSLLAQERATRNNTNVAQTSRVVNPTWSQAGDIARGYHYWNPESSQYSPSSATSSDRW